MVLLWRVRGNGNGRRVFLLPRSGGTDSKVRFVFLLGCFFSLDLYIIRILTRTKSQKDYYRGQKDYYLFFSVRIWMYYGARQIQDCLPWYWRVKYCSRAIQNIRRNPLPDLIENRWVVAFVSFFFYPKDRTSKHVLCTVWNIFYLSLLFFFNFPRTWRLAAYRQFTSWTHGALGKKTGEWFQRVLWKPIDTSFLRKLDNMPGSGKHNSS